MASRAGKWAAWLALTGASLGFVAGLVIIVLAGGATAVTHTQLGVWEKLNICSLCTAGGAFCGAFVGLFTGTIFDGLRNGWGK